MRVRTAVKTQTYHHLLEQGQDLLLGGDFGGEVLELGGGVPVAGGGVLDVRQVWSLLPAAGDPDAGEPVQLEGENGNT